MKLRKLVLYAIPFVTLFALQSLNTAYAQNKKLKRYALNLGGQSNKTKGGFVNLEQGKVLGLPAAYANRSQVDFVYAYGKNTGINLMAPGSSRLGGFGSYRKNVKEQWDVLNKGRFINLTQSKEARKLFKKMKTHLQLINAYEESIKNVKSLPNYQLLTHGPSLSLRQMQVGDVFLFKSLESNIYAIGRIMDVKTGFNGDIQIDIKVAAD